MNLLSRIKRAFTSQRYLETSMQVVHGGDGKRQPFSALAAVNSYRSWIYAAANLNAVAVASQPIRLYVRRRGEQKSLWKTRRPGLRTKAYLAGDASVQPSPRVMSKAAEYGDDYEVVTEMHPVLEVLSKFNPYTNGFDGTVLRVLYTELTGNAYLHPVIDQTLGRPSELWVMPSQWMEIVPGKQKLIDGFLYGASREQRRFFPEDEVIHFKRPNPADLYYGLGKAEAAWGAAMANEAIHEMDLAFFSNRARPDYLLTFKGVAAPEEIERLEVQIDEKLRGKKRTGRFLTMSSDVDLKPMGFPTKDLAGRVEIIEEIAAVFGVPVSMLKANDPNLASAQVGFASWKANTILPLLRMDEETLNQSLLPLFGIEDDAFLAYDNPVLEDERFEFERVRSAVAGGLMTVNEARELQGLPASEDEAADRLLFNNAPLGGIPAPSLPPLPEASPSGPAGPGGGGEVTTLIDERVGQEPEQAAAEAEPITTKGAKCACQDARLTLGVHADPEEKAAGEDCVSEKIRTLLDEGYEQDQAVAIAISMCDRGNKALEDIDTKPPAAVASNAARALEVRGEKPPSQRGMTAVGIARARDLANRVAVSEETIRRMAAYFERHEVDKQGATWDEQGAGWQAWNGWGGDEGWSWAKRKRDEFDRARSNSDSIEKRLCRGASTMTAKVEVKNCGTGDGGFKPGNECGKEDASSSDATGTPRSSIRTLVEDVQNAEIVEDGSVRISGDDNAVRETAKRLSEKWQGAEFTQDDSLKLVDKVMQSGVATQDYRDAAAAYTLTDGDDILMAQSLRRSGKTFEQLELGRLREIAKKPGSVLANMSDEALQSRARQRASSVEKLAESVTQRAQTPLPEVITVHRGMRASSDESREFVSKLKVGDAVETGIISTSLNPKVSRDYAGDGMSDRVLMKISTSKGIVAQTDERNVRYENHLQEVVLAPKRLRVRSVTRIAAETDRQAAGEGWGDLIIGGQSATLTLVEMEAEYD